MRLTPRTLRRSFALPSIQTCKRFLLQLVRLKHFDVLSLITFLTPNSFWQLLLELTVKLRLVREMPNPSTRTPPQVKRAELVNRLFGCFSL